MSATIRIARAVLRQLIDNTPASPHALVPTAAHRDFARPLVLEELLPRGVSLDDWTGAFLRRMVAEEPDLTLVPLGPSRALKCSAESLLLIDHYLDCRATPTSELIFGHEFSDLLCEIVRSEQAASASVSFRGSADVVFNDAPGRSVFVLARYSDCTAKGKYRAMPRDLLRTFAALVRALPVDDATQLRPLTYYFDNRRRTGNVFIPSSNIIYGPRLFTEYFPSLSYADVDAYLRSLGDDPEIVQLFDALYQSIRHGELGRKLVKEAL